MASERVGPLVTVTRSCQGCVHVKTERYRAQGDSGCDVTCTHPPERYIGDTTWNTPKWCPFWDGPPPEGK